jgi:hypothetical protein
MSVPGRYISFQQHHFWKKSGDRVGTKLHDKEKRLSLDLANPLIYLVELRGIEPLAS